ncbi:hypothetical protein EC844_12624 [Acinetobacter calcoaceticus]|uniref:Bacteriophage protein n=1 Tax=Acinetobacter calcoaceticus TaxID=471 RepID=A0A4R1XIJ6_ACICA|nr:hypothetical protein EC844_12624 [Acinetobacter calcoaceticus]
MGSILNQQERQTELRELGLFSVPVKAGAVIVAGFAAAVDATGFAVAASAATGLTYLGRYEDSIDNTHGSDGDFSVLVRNQCAFHFSNSPSDPVEQVSFGKECFLQDGETVAATDGDGKLSKAGRVVGIDENGVWVE